MEEKNTPKVQERCWVPLFKAVSVLGNSVRIRTGAAVLDIKVDELGNGKLYVNIPHNPYIRPEHMQKLINLVLATYRAHKEVTSGETPHSDGPAAEQRV